METINNRVKMVRETLGLTSSMFAQKLNVKAGTVSMLETGTSKPGAEILIKISETFGVPTDWLLKGEGVMFKDVPKPEVSLTPITIKVKEVKEVKAVVGKEIVDVGFWQKLLISAEDKVRILSDEVAFLRKQNEYLIAK